MPTPRQHPDAAARQKAYRARTKQAVADQLVTKGLPPTAIIPTMPSTARWCGLREQALAALTAMSDEMSSYWDDRSEAVAAVGEIALE